MLCFHFFFLLPERVNDNIWAACCTTQNYNLSFKGGGNGGRGFAAIVGFTWDFIVFAEQTKIEVLTMDPVFHSEVLPVWEVREFILFFLETDSLEEGWVPQQWAPNWDGQQPFWVQSGVDGHFASIILAMGTSLGSFHFLLPPLVECHLAGIAFKWFTLWMFSVEHCVFPLSSEFNFSNWIKFYVTLKWELSSSHHPSLCPSILVRLLFIAPIYWPYC